jgi:uncharacterized integral membrane protein
MIILFILGLFLGGVAVIFALENMAPITVTFFHAQITGSLALILITAILSGVLITLLLLLPESISNYFKNKKLAGEVARLEEELKKQKTLTSFAKILPPTPQVIDQIDRGTISTKEESQS